MIIVNGWFYFFAILAIIGILAAILVYVRKRPKIKICFSPGCHAFVTGPTGAASVGVTGPQGDQGEQGPTGSTGFANISFTGNTGGAMVLLNSNTFNISNGNIIGSGYITTAANEFMASFVMTDTFTLQNLFVNLTTVPGGGNARVFTVRVNGGDTPLVVTISGFTTSGSNTVNTVPVLAGDRVSLQVTNIGTPMPSTCEASYSYA